LVSPAHAHDVIFLAKRKRFRVWGHRTI
jgi:hypothetical protein